MTEQEAAKILKSDSCWGCPDSSGSAANCTYGACRMSEATRKAIAALEEIQQYRAIGTAEQYREAVEKQREKKPVKRSFVIPYGGIDVCPNCKEPISKKEHHCKCGQAIDWSEEE